MITSQAIDSFALHLQAEGKSPKTIRTYTDAARKLRSDRSFAAVTRQDVERHIAGIIADHSPGYASNQFRALQQFFRWLAAEEEIPNVMAGMKVPTAVPPAVPVLTAGDIAKLLATCKGRRVKQRRDTAIILLFRDTGCRLAELAGLTADDIDLRNREALVTGKGNRQRWVKFGAQTALAIDRYQRSVAQSVTTSAGMWGMTANGIYQMIKRRAAQAGVQVHPHQFRHSFAHTWLDNGGMEGDLMMLAGWRSAAMLRRYGASAASARARRSYDRVMGG